MERNIDQIVWDMTVGAGMSEVESPRGEDFAQISYSLKRPLTSEDKQLVRRAWARCIQEMNQP